MFIHTLKKQQLYDGVFTAFLLLAVGLFLWRPQALAAGVQRGLSICGRVIVPTLYPFMVLAGFLTESPLCRHPGKALEKATQWLFGLPGCCGPAILLSLCGGYPAGAVAIGSLLRRGAITPAQARRMTRFCVNAGPGFIVSTVGAGLLGNMRAGWLLFFAHALVSLAMGITLGQGHRRKTKTVSATGLPARSAAQVVGDTCQNLLNMCGFVLLATAVLSLVESVGLSRLAQAIGIPAAGFSKFFPALTEVSCGCMALAGQEPLTPLWLSLCLSWGGLSVQGQIWASLRGALSPDRGFFLARLLHGALSGGLSMLLFAIIPGDRASLSAMAAGDHALPFSVNETASLALLGFTFLAMLVFSPKKTGKIPPDVL